MYKRQARRFGRGLTALGVSGLLVGAAGWAGLEVGRGRLTVSYTHLRAHETVLDLVCRLLLEKKKSFETMYSD